MRGSTLYIKWNINRTGRTWRGGEALDRFQMAPEKTEMVSGKLFNNDRERLIMLALLLENVGADKAVQLGSPEVWRDAVAQLQ